MSTVTKPLLLDETGKAIVAALQSTEIVQQRVQEIREEAWKIRQDVYDSLPENYDQLLKRLPQIDEGSEQYYLLDINDIDKTLTHENMVADAKTVGNRFMKVESDMKRSLDIWGLRGAMNGEYTPLALPEYEHLQGIRLPVFTDGYRFLHNIDLRELANVSTNIVTVSTQEEFAAAINAAASGDTIVLNSGCYEKVTLPRSINLIGNGNVVFTAFDIGDFEETATHGIYRSKKVVGITPFAIYDATIEAQDIIVELTRAASVAECIATKGSYSITNSGFLYVHPVGNARPKNTNILISTESGATIRYNGTSENGTVYLENIKVVGGGYNVWCQSSEAFKAQKLVAVDCKFYYAQLYNAVYCYGVDGYFQRCLAAYAYKDGFNYHKSTNTSNVISNGLEVDCVGHDNGNRDSSATPSNNGSTQHDGGKIIRINGTYYNNNGGNVADTSANTVSHNYGCLAFDSRAPHDNTNDTCADFWADNSAQMYLYGCRAVGDSQYHLVANNSAHISHVTTEYSNDRIKGGIGSI